MDVRLKQRKAERIDEAVAYLRERWEAEDVDRLEDFLRTFYRGVPHDDVASATPDAMYGAAVAVWRFAERRLPGEALVRVYTPHPEQHGWHSPHSVVEVVGDDMPFLVDSVTAELQRRDAEVQLVIHPILDVRRDPGGRLVALGQEAHGKHDTLRESWIQILIRAESPERQAALAAAVEDVLLDVRAAVEDWKPMLERTAALAGELRRGVGAVTSEDADEAAAFLDWLADDHFTFLGYREYVFAGEGEQAIGTVAQGSGLGVLRDPDERVFCGLLGGGPLPPDVREFLQAPEVMRITKGNLRSTVHRNVFVDTLTVKRYDDSGSVTGCRLLVGLFTSRAYAANPARVPVLRRKVLGTLQRASVPPETHDGRALLHILTAFPRDELAQISQGELVTTALGILDLQERPRTALFARVDPFERFVSCLVYAPRDRYDTSLRLRFVDILTRAWGGPLITFSTRLDESPLVRLHFTIETTPERGVSVDVPAVEQELAQAARSFLDRVEQALLEECGEEKATRWFRRYRDAFPAAYVEHYTERDAVVDIAHVEEALAGTGLALNLYRPLEAPEGHLRFKIYAQGRPAPLSHVLPILENMGFLVLGEEPFRIRPAGLDSPFWIRDLYLQLADPAQTVDLDSVRERFHEAARLVWRGELENDGFNRLVVKAGMSAREVTILRAYCRFLRQARMPFSQAYVEQTLASEPEIARKLVELFLVRFDPDLPADERSREADLRTEVSALLDRVSNLDMDRIIRRYLEVIGATLRTNYFQVGPDGEPKPYLSFKLDSQRIASLPRPRPYREIFVYSPRVEAVHLRGGKVARGGLRWSDRPEDFRTEVLGLMKAQMVKNTVIVPVGSKGGFVPKRLPSPEAGREAVLTEGIEAYKTMIRGLLDLTDNLDGDAVVPPPRVIRHDEDDPYLVVAADKGTATFSDIANGVSAEYGFWLGDAFASGGSAGYDHKKMAITARGAWECVQRHFREIGKDIQAEDFTVLGVGDMSGDVFGNGMLLSPHIRLLGAFDHRHIFVDPDPDAATSFGERRRLFDLPRSSWADYDASLISVGGGVYERTRKSIPVSPQMRTAFDLEGQEVTPAELIQAMLRAPVELLWFGGIGTYVKASSETHADVGDRASDALRIDARQLRAQVVGEGANLALTQRGRIEAALSGVRLNTDALDNSAGVDCSDHEVNIKILLGETVRAGDLTGKRRDLLLEEMTDEVARLVLRDNYLQSQAITVAQQKGASLLDRLGRFMRALEKEGRLDRTLEFLPDDETLAQRLKDRVGLTRPELAVLLAYAKIVLFDELLPSNLPDDTWMADELVRYFPIPLRAKYAAGIGRHRLHREIVATMVTNTMLNRVGIAFVHEMKEKTGMPAADVARAYLVARDVLDLPDLWQSIEGLDNQIPAGVQAEMLASTSNLVEQVVVWVLRELSHPLDVPATVAAFREGVRDLTAHLEELLPASHRTSLEGVAQRLVARGAPEDLARRVAGLEALEPACDIVRIAGAAGVSVLRAAQVHYSVGETFGFDWLHRAAVELPADTAWEKLAVSSVVDDLYASQGALTAGVLREARAEDSASGAVSRWSDARRARAARTRALLAELEAVARPDLAMLAVAGRQLKDLGS